MLDELRRRRFRRPRLSPETRTRLDVTRHRLAHGIGPRVAEFLLAVLALVPVAVRYGRRVAQAAPRHGRHAAQTAPQHGRHIALAAVDALRRGAAAAPGTAQRYAVAAQDGTQRYAAAAHETGRELATAVAEGRGREAFRATARTGWDRWREAVATGGGRRALAATAAVAVLAVGLVGVQDTADHGGTPGGDVTATERERQLDERRDASDRGDRGSRDGTGPEASPSAGAQGVNAAGWAHPMPGAETTSCFGQRWGTLHGGVDLASPPGTPIQTVGDGTVVAAGWAYAGYGISVLIDHHNGFYTHYAHASEARVSAGDQVSAGEVVALEGNTGDSNGPHLHFEVHQGSMMNQVEPTQWLANREINIPGC